MRKLHFDYAMEIVYSVEVEKCNFTIKCFPHDTLRQRVSNVLVNLSPKSNFQYGVDGLLNKQIYGMNDVPHKRFFFHIEGDADVGLSPYEEEENDNLTMVFKHPHGLNLPGDGIRAYFEKNNEKREMSAYERAVDLMHKLHHDFTYAPCTTDIKTTAEEAFVQGKGVCQDYAHIFIALMHLAGIPARYVTGLIVGEGASHAWVEILWDGKWFGLDPTNDAVISDEHIKIGVGRDANDCTINRGIMHGGGFHTQTIQVNVTERDTK